MSIDEWVDRDHVTTVESANPSARAIRSAIEALDQKRHTTVAFERARSNLVVGGGRGVFVVSGTLEDDTVITLQRLDAGRTSMLKLAIGGQESAYSSRIVVSLEQAIAGVQAFLSDGQLPTDLAWESK